MGIPLSTDGIPATLHGTVYCYRNVVAPASAQGVSTITYGPYSMTRAPMRGDVSVGMGGPVVDADEVWFFTTGVNIQFDDVLTRIETQQNWIVVDVKPMPSRLLIYVKRAGSAVPGNT
jgi:hypothetical protein